METALPQHICEFADVAARRFARLGGPQAALLAETDGGLRQHAREALDDIGATGLAVRTDLDDTLAAAAVCRAAGATLLPYPTVAELMAVEGARLALIDPRAARVNHGDLAGRWLLADLDCTAYASTMSERTAAKLAPFLVAASELTVAGSVPQSDVALHLILDSWHILGALERALAIARDHVKVRTQFGQALAEFQAVRFSVADASVAVSGLEQLAHYTLSRWSSVDSAIGWTDALMLKMQAADTAVATMRTCHQLLGALGFCDESDVSVIDRHLQPHIRLPAGADDLARRLATLVDAGHVETLFGSPAR